MVSVPGRSKGCHTCRKRRIKCDETKPICLRCSKAGYKCLGYERQLEIRFAPKSATGSTTSSRSQTPVQIDSLHTVWRLETPSPPSPPPELSLVAFRDDMCQSFLFANFVWRTFGSGWLDLSVAGKLGKLPLEASRALAWSNFGNSHHEDSTKIQGGILYGATIKAVAPILSDPRQPRFEELIVPIMAMLIHASSQADREGAISHVKGLTQLLLICGPEKFQKEPLRQAFESCRASLLITSLLTRRASFFALPPWQTLPWSLNPSTQSPQSQLVSILAFVPGFLEEDAQLDRCWDADLHLDLLAKIETQLHQLFMWRWRWEWANGQGVGKASSEEQSDLHFDCLEQAIEVMTYDAVLLWLLGLLWKLSPLGAGKVTQFKAEATRQETQSEVRKSALDLPEEHVRLNDVAVELVKAFDFLMSNVGNRNVSVLLFLMPVGLAWSVLEGDEYWRGRIQGALASSSITSGYQTGQNVFGFGTYSRPTPENKENSSATLWLSHSAEDAWNVEDDREDQVAATSGI